MVLPADALAGRAAARTAAQRTAQPWRGQQAAYVPIRLSFGGPVGNGLRQVSNGSLAGTLRQDFAIQAQRAELELAADAYQRQRIRARARLASRSSNPCAGRLAPRRDEYRRPSAGRAQCGLFGL